MKARAVVFEAKVGPGEHVRRHQATPERPRKEKPMAPVTLNRERQIEVCAQCHGGVGELVESVVHGSGGRSSGT